MIFSSSSEVLETGKGKWERTEEMGLGSPVHCTGIKLKLFIAHLCFVF